MTTTVTARSQPRGASLLPPAVAYVALAVAGIIGPPLVAGRAPYSSDADLLGFYTDHAGAAHLLAFLVLASAVPFAVCTAIASHRVRAAGLDVPGRLIALAFAAGGPGSWSSQGSWWPVSRSRCWSGTSRHPGSAGSAWAPLPSARSRA